MIAIGRACGATLALFFGVVSFRAAPWAVIGLLFVAAICYAATRHPYVRGRRGRTAAALALMAVTVSIIIGCGSARHKATVAANGIAKSLSAAAQINHDLYAQGLIDKDEQRLVGQYIVQATLADDALNELAQQADADGKIDTVRATNLFRALTDQVDKLNTEGVLHLKSDQAKKEFAVKIAAIRSGLAVLQALLNAVPPATKASFVMLPRSQLTERS